MEPGTILQSDKLYWTKNGFGDVIPFNGRIWKDETTIFQVFPTATKDVWWHGISRHISHIAETKEEAKNIKY